MASFVRRDPSRSNPPRKRRRNRFECAATSLILSLLVSSHSIVPSFGSSMDATATDERIQHKKNLRTSASVSFSETPTTANSNSHQHDSHNHSSNNTERSNSQNKGSQSRKERRRHRHQNHEGPVPRQHTRSRRAEDLSRRLFLDGGSSSINDSINDSINNIPFFEMDTILSMAQEWALEDFGFDALLSPGQAAGDIGGDGAILGGTNTRVSACSGLTFGLLLSQRNRGEDDGVRNLKKKNDKNNKGGKDNKNDKDEKDDKNNKDGKDDKDDRGSKDDKDKENNKDKEKSEKDNDDPSEGQPNDASIIGDDLPPFICGDLRSMFLGLVARIQRNTCQWSLSSSEAGAFFSTRYNDDDDGAMRALEERVFATLNNHTMTAEEAAHHRELGVLGSVFAASRLRSILGPPLMELYQTCILPLRQEATTPNTERRTKKNDDDAEKKRDRNFVVNDDPKKEKDADISESIFGSGGGLFGNDNPKTTQASAPQCIQRVEEGTYEGMVQAPLDLAVFQGGLNKYGWGADFNEECGLGIVIHSAGTPGLLNGGYSLPTFTIRTGDGTTVYEGVYAIEEDPQQGLRSALVVDCRGSIVTVVAGSIGMPGSFLRFDLDLSDYTPGFPVMKVSPTRPSELVPSASVRSMVSLTDSVILYAPLYDFGGGFPGYPALRLFDWTIPDELNIQIILELEGGNDNKQLNENSIWDFDCMEDGYCWVTTVEFEDDERGVYNGNENTTGRLFYFPISELDPVPKRDVVVRVQEATPNYSLEYSALSVKPISTESAVACTLSGFIYAYAQKFPDKASSVGTRRRALQFGGGSSEGLDWKDRLAAFELGEPQQCQVCFGSDRRNLLEQRRARYLKGNDVSESEVNSKGRLDRKNEPNNEGGTDDEDQKNDIGRNQNNDDKNTFDDSEIIEERAGSNGKEREESKNNDRNNGLGNLRDRLPWGNKKDNDNSGSGNNNPTCQAINFENQKSSNAYIWALEECGGKIFAGTLDLSLLMAKTMVKLLQDAVSRFACGLPEISSIACSDGDCSGTLDESASFCEYAVNNAFDVLMGGLPGLGVSLEAYVASAVFEEEITVDDFGFDLFYMDKAEIDRGNAIFRPLTRNGFRDVPASPGSTPRGAQEEETRFSNNIFWNSPVDFNPFSQVDDGIRNMACHTDPATGSAKLMVTSAVFGPEESSRTFVVDLGQGCEETVFS